MIIVSFFFYIWVRLIGTLILKPGPRFIVCIICIICIVCIARISCISSTELAIIYPELRQVGRQASLQSLFFKNFNRCGPGRLHCLRRRLDGMLVQ